MITIRTRVIRSIVPLFLGVLFLFPLIHTCQRFEPVPILIVSTDTITNISYDSCSVYGTIVQLGIENITEHGFCWSESDNPTTGDNTASLGARSSVGDFSADLKELVANSQYYIRAYASSESETIYGKQVSFTTSQLKRPVVTTSSLDSITYNSVKGGGVVTDNGGGLILVRGVCWSTSRNPTRTNDNTSDGHGLGVFESSITGLACKTIYYVRAYATNTAGTSYGNELSFTTKVCPPFYATLTTNSADSITDNSAISGGDITDDGGSPVTARGVCWSTSENPVTSDSCTIDGGGSGSFISRLNNLSCETPYYIRAYATNSDGTSYGDQISFTTSGCPSGFPTVTTSAINNITLTTAQGGGEVTDQGDGVVTVRGVCWSTAQNPTISDYKTTDGAGTGEFGSAITGLSCGTTYYVRAYATNSSGTGYGVQVSFSTSSCAANAPSVTTISVNSITETSAQAGGNVTDDGGAAVTDRGLCWSTSQNPTTSDSHTNDGNGSGSFTSSITGLFCDTYYYVRAYATNASGTAYGAQVSFTTSLCPTPAPPTVTTIAVTGVTETTAQCGGNVTDDGGATVTARGVCWSTESNPTIENNITSDGIGTGSFTSNISGLTKSTTYYVRAYATNAAGTGYGELDSLKTLLDNSKMTDFDGNVYNTIQIGDQVWMQENLKVTHYADGTPIPLVENDFAWMNLSFYDKAFCWYDNSASNRDIYGGLYTWAATMNGEASSFENPSGVQGVCPDNWHVPSDGEWKQMEMHLGMSKPVADAGDWRGSVEGGKLKEAGTSHWASPNEGATNLSGFTALPGGARYPSNGACGYIGYLAGWWNSSEYGDSNAWCRFVDNRYTTILRLNDSKEFGFSVRCVRD